MLLTHRFATTDAPPGLLARVRPMLDDAFGKPFSGDDWGHAIGGHHIVVTDGDRVVAHAAVVPRRLWLGERPLDVGFLEAVATAPDRQGTGIGRSVVIEISERVRRDFAMGGLSTARHGFYERLGWERWAGPTFVRQLAGALVRTAVEDDGVMVLRHGPNWAVDLTGPIACEPRPGDDW